MPITPVAADDPLAASADPVAANLEAVRALFPAAITEGKIDFDTLRQLLGDLVEDGDERYGLNWSGKRASRRLALTPSLGTLRPAREDSVDWDATRNIVIEGDNLEVLKLLQKSYAGRVKLIYIDPPYNTGNDFIYPDDYSDSIGNYLRRTGQVDRSGLKNTSNAESSGRYHTDWLNMMYPRLLLARGLLHDGGLIVVHADQNEICNLTNLMSLVFGEDLFVTSFVVISNPRGRQSDRFVATVHEYMVVFGRDLSQLKLGGAELTEDQRLEFSHADEFGPYRLLGLRQRGAASLRSDRPEMFFPVFVSQDGQRVSLTGSADFPHCVLPRKSSGEDGRWMWGKTKCQADIARMVPRLIERRGEYDIFVKDYLNRDGRERARKLKSVLDDKSFNNQVGTQEVKALFEADVVSFPKPVALIKQILQLNSISDDIILDFFAGSGTTGHAVMAQNAADAGSRRYILVQLPEPLDPANKDQKVAADFCDALGRPRTIAELTKERLRRAAVKIRADNPDATFDGGLRVYKLATSNLKVWQPGADLEKDLLDAADNLLPDRTEDDLLVELLLKRGIDLTEPQHTRTIAGSTVYALGGGVLVVCLADVSVANAEALADGMAEWIVELDPIAPAIVMFKDSGFESDVAKANVEAILRQRLRDRGDDLPHLLDQVRSL